MAASEDIWLKLTQSLTDMHVRVAAELPITVAVSPQQEFRFVMKSVQGHADQLSCEVTVKESVLTEVHGMFASLASGKLPQQNPPVIELPHELSIDVHIDKDGTIPSGWGVQESLLPHKMRDFIARTRSSLTDSVREFIETIQWVQDIPKGRSLSTLFGFHYSLDGERWHLAPVGGYRMRMINVTQIDLRPAANERLVEVWSQGRREPLHHELLREAVEVAGRHNPRSALLMGMTALETGLKNHVAWMVPDAALILEKLPSPPVLTLCQDVIPSLYKNLGRACRGFPLEKSRADYLRKWVSQRNQVAHGVKARVDHDGLDTFLGFVRSLLYALDLNEGQEWASRFVQS